MESAINSSFPAMPSPVIPFNSTNITFPPSPPIEPLQEQEVFASLSILLQIVLLGASFIVGHILRRRKMYYIYEASAAMIIGLVAGTIANLANSEQSFKKWLNFREEFFLLFLLPPIIFQSGFSLRVTPFFSNFGAICAFAFLGTILAALTTAILVYVGGLLFLIYRLSFLESLVFGAVISSTDPVSVLAIFQELGADTNLYALVFGESVLNDAAAIVLYRTVTSVLLRPSGTYSVFSAIQYSVVTFFGSTAIGIGVALSCALIFKYAGLSVRNLHNLECCLIVLFPYISYMVAEGYALSGIVAILFCGIIMKRYTFPNLSEHAQMLSAGFFQLIASLAETFTFIYMGVDIALGERHSWSHTSFILLSIVIIVVARAANVFPISYAVNMWRPKRKKIPPAHQKALFFSGLRGAMAFALALQSVHDLPDGQGEAIFTATTVIVMLTVLVIGGSTSTMLEKLGLVGDQSSQGFNDRDNSSDDEKHLLPGSGTKEDTGSEMMQRRLRILSDSASFSDLDTKYFRPFFTTQSDEKLAQGKFGNSSSESPSINDKSAMISSKISNEVATMSRERNQSDNSWEAKFEIDGDRKILSAQVSSKKNVP